MLRFMKRWRARKAAIEEALRLCGHVSADISSMKFWRLDEGNFRHFAEQGEKTLDTIRAALKPVQ